jgi:8-oxo-dGTP diphosphatase
LGRSAKDKPRGRRRCRRRTRRKQTPTCHPTLAPPVVALQHVSHNDTLCDHCRRAPRQKRQTHHGGRTSVFTSSCLGDSVWHSGAWPVLLVKGLRGVQHTETVIGVAVVVVGPHGRILVGYDERRGGLALPGGHWDKGERLEEAAKREVVEESGILCGSVRPQACTMLWAPSGERWLSFGVSAKVYGEKKPRDCPREGRFEWRWMSPAEASRVMVLPSDRRLIKACFGQAKGWYAARRVASTVARGSCLRAAPRRDRQARSR